MSQKYQDVVARAKAKVQARPGSLEGMARFDELSTEQRVLRNEEPAEARPATLSEATVAGLEALMQANAERASVGSEPQDAPPLEELTDEEKLRRAIEARCTDIDIGQYLVNGTCTQEVPIIKGKLTVRYRLATDAEEVFLDRQIREETTRDNLSQREIHRRMNEWAVAFGIYALNDTVWPAVLRPDGTVDPDAAQIRLANVRKMSFPLFSMLFQNLVWFTERVTTSLTFEALKNG